MSPAHSWLLVLGIFLAAWVAVRVLEVVDEELCHLAARLRRWWRAEQVQQRQDDLARTRKARVRALAKRARA